VAAAFFAAALRSAAFFMLPRVVLNFDCPSLRKAAEAQ
jgi:hypothetical protein